MTPDCVERAFELAEAGAVRDMKSLIGRLRREGFPTALTDLRSTSIRRELSRLLARHGDPAHALASATSF